MTLEEIFIRFGDRFTDIALYQRAAKNTAKKELEELNKYAEHLKTNPSMEKFGFSVHSMHFNDPITGEARSYGYRKSSVSDRTLLVVKQKNKQYCWLLAEAYEEFEDYLESIYAYIGMRDNSTWLMSDYGNVSQSDLVSKDFDWYLERARNKRDAPQSILSRLRILYPELPTAEVNNKLNVNLKVAIELIERLRHIIVHKGGVTGSKKQFIEDVLKASGVWKNGKPEQGHVEFIEKFFGTENYENVISLLEVRIHPEIPLDIHYDRYGQLSGYLVAYAFLVYQTILGASA